jgi:hypothetical protein
MLGLPAFRRLMTGTEYVEWWGTPKGDITGARGVVHERSR